MPLSINPLLTANGHKKQITPVFDAAGNLDPKNRTKDFSENIKSKNPNSIVNGETLSNHLMIDNVKDQLEFSMQVFLSQLKNQIPGDETDTNQMVETLMGMMQTVQQVRTNTLLEDGNNIHSSLFGVEVARFQGRMAEHKSPIFSFDGNVQEFFVEASGAQGVLVITDGEKAIKTLTLPPSAKRQAVTWDGTNEKGEKAPEGIYAATVFYGHGKDIKESTEFTVNSEITAVEFDKDNKTIFKSGELQIDDVQAIRGRKLPRYESMQQKQMNIDLLI